MRIKKLELKDFRGFEELTIDFPEVESGLAVFVGVNGSGKTSVIEGISNLVHLFYKNILRLYYRENLDAISFFNDRLLNKSDIRVTSDKFMINGNFEFFDLPDFTFSHECSVNGQYATWPISSSWVLDENDLKEPLLKEMNEDEYKKLIELKKEMRKYVPLFKIYPTNRFASKSPSLKAVGGEAYSRLNLFISAFASELNYNDFFEWFRNTEDYENENRLHMNPEYRHEGLEAVRRAFSIFIPQIKKPRVQRQPREELVVEKEGQIIPIVKLSDGEKSLFTLMGDIIRRLSLNYYLNPENLLEKPGIIIIDEIDQHLHPKWQRTIVPKLREVFPNIQFIVTTHSPQVISTLKKENVFILNDFKLVKDTPHTFGRDSNSILWDIFGVEKRPPESKLEFEKLYRLMDDPDKIKETENMLRDVEEKYGYYDEEVIRARGQFEFLNED